MTLKEIANKLQSQGAEVHYRARKDGSIRITSINGMKFKGSEGNAQARSMVGERLSPRRTWQLQSKALLTPKGQFGHKKTEKLEVESLRKQLRRVQRIYRGQGITEGIPTMRNVLFTLKRYGLKEAEERLTQTERHARHLAYPINLHHFVERTRQDGEKLSARERYLVFKICDYIEKRINNEQIYEEQLQKLIDKRYELLEIPVPRVDEWYALSHEILVSQQYAMKYAPHSKKRKRKE